MMDRKRGLATVVAASVMVVGGATGAAAAAPRPAPVAAVSTAVSTVTVAPAALAVRAAAPTTTLAVAPDGAAASTRSFASWVAGIVLKYSGVAWSTLKSIVSKGYTYFKGWWDNLSSWVRWTIHQLVGLSIGEIFNQLRSYFF